MKRFFLGAIAGIVISLLLVIQFAGGTPLFASTDFTRNLSVLQPPFTFIFNEQTKTGDRPGEFFNGNTYVPLGFLLDGTTYVPLRFISESLGKDVSFDRESYTIRISDKLASAPAVPPNLADTTQVNIGIFELKIGDTTEQLLQKYGQPNRKDESRYGYTWWIYNDPLENYVQFGIANDKIVVIYSNASTWNYNSISVGSNIADVREVYSLDPQVVFSYGNANYTFDVLGSFHGEKYLVVEGDTAIEFYFDIHDNQSVTAIRISDLPTLLTTGGYSASWTYSGNPPAFEPPILSAEKQQLVNKANERQIFDLVNVIRLRNGLPLLAWDEQTAEIAHLHTLDMLRNNFFDHVSPSKGTLSDRFQRANVAYRLIGENIAMGQSDAIEAHEGWMNSAGHRSNILHPDYRFLGVGAFDNYYTQNFLLMPTR